jgi:hypothetical protein
MWQFRRLVSDSQRFYLVHGLSDKAQPAKKSKRVLLLQPYQEAAAIGKEPPQPNDSSGRLRLTRGAPDFLHGYLRAMRLEREHSCEDITDRLNEAR